MDAKNNETVKLKSNDQDNNLPNSRAAVPAINEVATKPIINTESLKIKEAEQLPKQSKLQLNELF